jgi:hypothetical protein
MSSILELYNIALGASGSRGKLNSVNDQTREAELCNLFYIPTRDKVFAAANWQNLRTTARLALIAERDLGDAWVDGDPSPNWTKAYAVPEGMVRPRFLSAYENFSLELLNGELTIQTHSTDAILVYTVKVDDPNIWDNALYTLIAYTLAMEICYPLTGDPSAYRICMDKWQRHYVESMTFYANIDQDEILEVVPPWIAARDGGFSLIEGQRFIYPVTPISYAPNPAQL